MPNGHLRRFLTLIPLILQHGCSDTQQMDGIPVEAVRAQPSVTTPAPPATGINPVTGWPGGLFGAVATYAHDLNTVSFHGGTWTVPIQVTPGQTISEVAFTIEAPTGSPGDPTSVRVGLYSNGNAIAFTPLTPFGMGVWVNGNIPLGGRVVAPGEVLTLEFSPLDAVNGGYAAHDTKIDAVQISRSHVISRTFWPTLINSNGAWGEGSIGIGGGAAGSVTTPGIASEPRGYYSRALGGARFGIPFQDGDRIVGFSIEMRGDGTHGSLMQIEWQPNMAASVTGSGTIIGSWTVPTHASGFAVTSADPSTFVPTSLSAGNQLYVWINATGPGLAFGPVVALFERPAS